MIGPRSGGTLGVPVAVEIAPPMRFHLILLATTLLAGAARAERIAPVPGPVSIAEEAQTWIAEKSDNICGLSDPKKLSNPAKVDYDALLKATAEMKKLEKEGIDPDSPQGKQLRKEATDKVTKASEKIRKKQGHCSVWKQIRHKDGRAVTDLTDDIKKEIT